MTGVHPGPFTLRQLWTMGEAAWEPWGELLAMFYNTNKPKDTSAEEGEAFNPYARPKAPAPVVERLTRKESMAVLKSMIGG